MKPSILLFLLCFGSMTSTLAQTPAQPTTYALIVGLSQYKEIAPLQFADRDATAFAGFLTTQHVPEANIKLFLNQEATRLNILDELSSLTQALKPHDRFYFYFGGHGDLEANIGAENALLLLYDSYKTGYFKGNEYLQLSELKTWFDALAQKQVEVIFIADACHSGGLIGGKTGLTKTQQALQARWAGITKMLSCRSDEYSLEGKQWGGGRGLFSYHLVNGLTGRADANKDKRVSLKELNTYLTSNVVKEANPNVQTPVIVGRDAQLLSTVSAAGMAQLADYEKRNFPIITEVNLKGDAERANAELISKLDTSLVTVYRKFSKALKEKRVSASDDSTDNALAYYKKLTARSIPANLVQLMKRNLGAGLIERELAIMKNVREKGQTYVVRNEKVLMPAIANLQEAMKLFGTTHYFYRNLQARATVLESQLPPKSYPVFANANTVDKNLQDQKEFSIKYNLGIKQTLVKGLALEPNMISTYALLASSYRANRQPDSAIHYQEKVIDLLPNQGYAYFNLAMIYQSMKYVASNNKPAPHPKAIEYLEKAIEVEPTLNSSYAILGDLHMSMYFDESNRNYAKAIPYYEKLVAPYEVKDQEFVKQGLTKIREVNSAKDFDPNSTNFAQLINHWSKLYFLHKVTGNTEKAVGYLEKIRQKAEMGQSVYGYLLVVHTMYDLLQWEEEESYLKIALDMQLKALKKREEEVALAPNGDKPLLLLKYREQLKGLGGTYRGLKDYAEAESVLQRAIAYPLMESPILSHLKLAGAYGITYKNTLLLQPHPLCVYIYANKDYNYSLDAYLDLFFLKWEQNKPDEAFAWLEKAFQVSVTELGNDISGKPFEKDLFATYKTLDKERFLALKAKYFPPTADKK